MKKIITCFLLFLVTWTCKSQDLKKFGYDFYTFDYRSIIDNVNDETIKSIQYPRVIIVDTSNANIIIRERSIANKIRNLKTYNIINHSNVLYDTVNKFESTLFNLIDSETGRLCTCLHSSFKNQDIFAFHFGMKPGDGISIFYYNK
jgi:hypothetical protein